MIDSLLETLQQECRVTPGERIVAGVSGGPDSLCLADALVRLGFQVVVAHLDHRLRPESANEAEQVRAFSQQRNLPFLLERGDVAGYAEAQGLSIEEAARNLRYQFLFQAAIDQEAQAVAVGHTADDQVETVLMHLLRGSGLSGLKGMGYYSLPNPWSRTIPLIRPLLGTWREEVLVYLAEQGVKPLYDESNLDTRFYRNRLRHDLIPHLRTYNPNIRPTLWRTADILREDWAVLEEVILQAWNQAVEEVGKGYVAFDLNVLRSHSPGIQRHLFRRSLDHLRPGLRDVDFAAIQRAIAFLQEPSASRQIDLVAGVRLLLEGERLWLAGWETSLPGGGWPGVPQGRILTLSVPGEVDLPAGWRLRAEIREHEGSEQNLMEVAAENADPFQAWLSLQALELPLQVRSRQPGDRIQPLGLDGHSIKISDLMINAHLSRRARGSWPLVLSADQVAWVPGLRLGHAFRLEPGATRAVHLHLYKEEP